MSSYSRYFKPALRSDVDVQLQTAFSDGNWASVVRLAEKRAKSLKDSHYEAIRICAESQLDGALEKYAPLVAIDSLVRGEAPVKDIETIDLYEWACRDHQQDFDYSQTFGVLRLRWVRANSRNAAGVQCLQACVKQWDLVNAQQIAAILDKSFANSGDRRYLFWSITLSFLLSTSPQCPDGKEKLYGLLALKQVERAAELTESSAEETLSDRGIRTEEELYLYFRVLATLGLKEELVKKMLSSRLGALKHFKAGRKQLLLEAVEIFQTLGKWDDLYELCRDALSHENEDGGPSFVAFDWKTWTAFVSAASRQTDDEEAFRSAHSILDKLTSVDSKISQMYAKNIALALLDTTFHMPKSLMSYSDSSDKGGSSRVRQLCMFLDQHYNKISAFDDVKAYVSRLTFEEAHHLIKVAMPRMIAKASGGVKVLSLHGLRLRFQYLLTTCPQTLSHIASHRDGQQTPQFKCRFCSEKTISTCRICLRNLIVDAVGIHGSADGDLALLDAVSHLDKDPRVDLSLVIAMSLLKLAGLQRNTQFSDLTASLLLQGLLVLDVQLASTPDETTLRLLLVQLYLLLGCGSYAYQLWVPMDVKRTIQDALSPLFFDRISSLSPGLFQGSRPLMEPLRSYYSTSLRDKSPVKIWDAFSGGNYSSVLDMAEFDSRLRSSCTLVMSIVEERRAARAFGRTPESDIDEISYGPSLSDTIDFVSSTDYGSLPDMESSLSAPIQDLVRRGPPLSNERAHLDLLAEHYLDLVTFKPPKEYKPTKPNDVAVGDRHFLTEAFSRIQHSVIRFLHGPDTLLMLTGLEHSYYAIISMLSGIVMTSLTTPRSEPIPDTLRALTTSLKTTLASLHVSFLASREPQMPLAEVFNGVTDMHALSTLRDAILAVKHTAAFVVAFHEREVARDRTGKSNVHKDILSELKQIDGSTDKPLSDIKDRLKMLKEKLGEGGWLDRMLEWTFGEESTAADGGYEDEVTRAVYQVVGGRAVVEDWAGRVVESWREGVKGWASVRME